MLFVLLISIAAISAADLNETDNTADDVLKEDNVKSNTFLDLWADTRMLGEKIDLDTDYKFNKTTDVNYDKGINIEKYNYEIIGNNGKAVGKNQVVTVKFNKKTYKLKTNAKGYVSLTIPDTATPGKYKLTATYKGQTIKRTVTVKQNLKTKKYTVKKTAKKLNVKATLKNGKLPVKGIWIIFKLNGGKYIAKTDKNGNAIFPLNKKIISKLKAGKTYTMKFSANRNTIKTTLKVKA